VMLEQLDELSRHSVACKYMSMWDIQFSTAPKILLSGEVMVIYIVSCGRFVGCFRVPAWIWMLFTCGCVGDERDFDVN
jgi:hypothetical protein